MRTYSKSLLIYLCLYSLVSQAEEYVWGEEFQEGDIISAATFNQIFSTLQKLNRSPVDADLVGTWSCSSVHSSTDNMNTNGWVTNNFIDTLKINCRKIVKDKTGKKPYTNVNIVRI